MRGFRAPCNLCDGGRIDRSHVRDGLGSEYDHLRTGKCELCNGKGSLIVNRPYRKKGAMRKRK